MKDVSIDIGFPKDYFLFWVATTQTPNNVTIKLYDSNEVYFVASKQSTLINPPVALGAKTISGNNLKVNIKIESDSLIYRQNAYDIKTDNGTVVGKGWDLCSDDGTDNDYNDVCISLVAWKTKG